VTSHPHGVPLDDPNLERYQHAHAIDHDMASTNMAISIARPAFAAGHPDDRDAARKAMTGPPAAMAVQATMNPFVDEAIGYDETAEQHSSEAVRHAQNAHDDASRWKRLAAEPVTLSDGSSQTRGQVSTGHEQRQQAAAQRETRGDHEHRATQPGPGARMLIGPVLALIEVFLLIWPVTNASWADPKGVAYVAGLVVIFLFMNDTLPRLAGKAARADREAHEAARELTAVGITTSRAKDTSAGRAVTGHVDQAFLTAARRRKMAFFGFEALVLVVYAAIMFTRVLRLAAPLGSPAFALLAAALITVFTAGAPVVMTWWWSQGNALGDQLREYGAITSESRILAERLRNMSLAKLRASGDSDAQTRLQLEHASQAVGDGYRVVAVGLQKAASILGLDTVHTPTPENLFAVDRPIRDRARTNLGRAGSLRDQVEQMLAQPGPFHPACAAPNPWETRTLPRYGLPDPNHVDPSQLGPLHATPARTGWPRHRVIATSIVLVAVAMIAPLVAVLVLR
jgi:hypothetical protein